MTVKSSLLILALALLTTTSAAQDNYRPKQKDLSWGVKADGLRMAAWTNPATDKVFVAVRNFSTRRICYCDSEDAYPFTVYARKGPTSQWQELKFKEQPQTVTVLPLCRTKTLRQNEEMRPDGSPKNDYSFSVDLRVYSFPADLSGAVEVKMVQPNVYCNGAGNTVGEVESRVLMIRLPFNEVAG